MYIGIREDPDERAARLHRWRFVHNVHELGSR